MSDKQRGRNLTAYEKETIINFNEGEDTTHIFTYNKTLSSVGTLLL
jgi:hypothetical protein